MCGFFCRNIGLSMNCNIKVEKEQDWREQAAALQKRLDYYEQENARLQLQNEALHETAWQLIQRIRTLERKK